MDKNLNKINDPDLEAQIEKVVPFHGYLSTGAFIGIQMLNLARNLLDIKEGERIFVTCETQNCLPDPFQILRGCTIGNKGLHVVDHGKMAATINKSAENGEKTIKAVRIVLDPEKTINYPVFHAWYMNERKVSHEDAISELIKADGDVYSWYFIEVPVPVKGKKNVTICSICGESFIAEENESLCKWCANPENQEW
jgi:formylmethanofuran dehydrogenase subunit E